MRRSARLALVEDNRADAELVFEAIEEGERNLKLRWYENGDQALEGLRREELPDLVLLDLNLPGLSGQEVLAALRQEQRTAALPIIIMSSSAVPSEIEECYRLGANCYVRKPFDYTTLVSVMREIEHFWLDTALTCNRQN